MKTIRHAVGSTVVVAWLSLGLSPACSLAPQAEAPHSAPAPAPPHESAPSRALTAQERAAAEPATLAEAEALLEKARADLDRFTLNEAGASRASGGVVAPSPATSPPAPAAPPRDEAKAEKSAAADSASAPPVKEANACKTVCKAFASLTRARDAVCRLDADGGKRCERARQIHEDASPRVASCGCAR